ncbi:hypothetical protein DXG01_003824 [Tephrocybe rancida]|nr:hypothetical protein DXG01_003824 [Tephrocybe rancida]
MAPKFTLPHPTAMGRLASNEVDNIYSQFMEHCDELTRRSSEHSSACQCSLAELKSDMKKIKNIAKRLSHTNAELRRKSEIQQTALDRALDAQDASSRKLNRAYKVIRDLADENDKLYVASDFRPIPRTADEVEDGKQQVLEEALAIITVSSDSNSGSDKTACQPQSPKLQEEGAPDSEPSHSPDVPTEVRSKSHKSSDLPSPITSGAESEGSDDTYYTSSSLDVEVVDDDDKVWYIHSGDNPPGASNMSWDADPRRLLEHSLITKRDVRIKLFAECRAELTHLSQARMIAKLEMVVDFGFRLHAIKDLAFLNDPMFLEEREDGVKKTYLLDWSTKDKNVELASYVVTSSETPIHTFVFPETRRRWFYVGAFTWQLVNPFPVWSSLGETDEILSKLLVRRPDFKKEDITTLLDGGHLSQLCVEISSDGLWEESKEFSRRMGHESPESA